MPRDDRLYLHDLLDAAAVISRIIDRYSFEEATSDEVVSAALLHKFTVIGEASTRVSAELKGRYPNIPWQLMAGLRNIVVHQYFSLKWPTIWQAATFSVPEAAAGIRRLMADEFPDDPRGIG
jgi:uncharacterized protein with HEPN domain